MIVRKSTEKDLSRIMEIYAHAREFMAANGNPNQWGPTNWPPRDLVMEDIRTGRSYLCEHENPTGQTDLREHEARIGQTDLREHENRPGQTDLCEHENRPERTDHCEHENRTGQTDLCEHENRTEQTDLCEHENRIIAVFFFDSGKDIEPTYRKIESGSWIGNDEYGVVHRIASDGSVKGAGKFCINWAYEQCGHLRMDTHGDNTIMQNLLTGLGFQKCGIIYVEEDDYPRFAYEKL